MARLYRALGHEGEWDRVRGYLCANCGDQDEGGSFDFQIAIIPYSKLLLRSSDRNVE